MAPHRVRTQVHEGTRKATDTTSNYARRKRLHSAMRDAHAPAARACIRICITNDANAHRHARTCRCIRYAQKKGAAPHPTRVRVVEAGLRAPPPPPPPPPLLLLRERARGAPFMESRRITQPTRRATSMKALTRPNCEMMSQPADARGQRHLAKTTLNKCSIAQAAPEASHAASTRTHTNKQENMLLQGVTHLRGWSGECADCRPGKRARVRTGAAAPQRRTLYICVLAPPNTMMCVIPNCVSSAGGAAKTTCVTPNCLRRTARGRLRYTATHVRVPHKQ